jgi:hypothetical protein
LISSGTGTSIIFGTDASMEGAPGFSADDCIEGVGAEAPEAVASELVGLGAERAQPPIAATNNMNMRTAKRMNLTRLEITQVSDHHVNEKCNELCSNRCSRASP